MKRVLAFAVVAILAIFFRLHALDSTPPGLFIDEAEDGLDAWDIATGATLPVYIEEPEVPARSREPMEHYVIAGVMKAFGPSIEHLRAGPALIGIATVLLFFWLCCRHMTLEAAFLASVLLATSRWHVTFSRIAMRAITTPLCIVIALLGFSYLVRNRRPLPAFVAGAALAVGFYSYPSYWIVPPILVLLALLGLLGLRRTGSIHQARLPLLIGAAAVGFLVVGGPMIHYAMTRPQFYFARAYETAMRDPDDREHRFTIRDNAQRALFMLHLRGDPEPRHNIPRKPLLDPVSGVAFLLGLYCLLRTWRDDTVVKVAMLLFWVLLLLPSVTTEGAPHAMRALGAVPAVCAIAGTGFAAFGRWLRGWPSKAVRTAGMILPLTAAGVSGAWNYYDYFYTWATLAGVQNAFSAPIPAFFEFYSALAARDDLYASPYIFNSPNLKFMNLSRGIPLQLIEAPEAFTVSEATTRDRVFICDDGLVNFLIEKLYPDAERLTTYSIFGASRGRVWRVRKNALRGELTPEERSEFEFALGEMRINWEKQRSKW